VQKDEDDLSPKSRDNFSLDEWKNSWMAKNNTPSIFISAITKENIDDFKKQVYDRIKEIHSQRFPYNDYLFSTDLELEMD
jgi:GTP-binding protein HflX